MTIISWQFPLPVRSKHTNAFFKVTQMSPHFHSLGRHRWTHVWRKNNRQGVWRGKTVFDILWLSPSGRGVHRQKGSWAAPSKRFSLHLHSCQCSSQSEGALPGTLGRRESARGTGRLWWDLAISSVPTVVLLGSQEGYPAPAEGCGVRGLAWARAPVSPSLLWCLNWLLHDKGEFPCHQLVNMAAVYRPEIKHLWKEGWKAGAVNQRKTLSTVVAEALSFMSRASSTAISSWIQVGV